MFALLLLCCAQPDACDTLCAHARSAFEACLDAQGADWGASTGFTSADDFDDWCDTFVWEEQQLDAARGPGDPAAPTCSERQAVIDDGDCAAWYTAWGESL